MNVVSDLYRGRSMDVAGEDQHRFLYRVENLDEPLALMQERGKAVAFIIFVVAADVRASVIDHPWVRRNDKNKFGVGLLHAFDKPFLLCRSKDEQIRVGAIIRISVGSFPAGIERKEVTICNLPVVVVVRSNAVGQCLIDLCGWMNLQAMCVDDFRQSIDACILRRVVAFAKLRVACVVAQMNGADSGRIQPSEVGIWIVQDVALGGHLAMAE